MKGYFAKYITVVFFCSLFFIFFNAVISFYNLKTLLQNEGLINHSEQVILAMAGVNVSVKNVEINQRNYLVTADDMYISPYRSSIKETQKGLLHLKQLVTDNYNQVKKVSNLENLFNKRVQLLEERITMFHENGLTDVQDAIKTGDGVRINQQITNIVQTFESDETKLLNTRREQSRMSTNRTYLTILISTIFSLFLIFIIYFLIKRELEYRSTMEIRKDEFISIATHELKTPITSLQVFAQILQKKLETKKDKELLQYSTRITNQVSRISGLISDLLDVSRLQLGKMKFEKAAFDLTMLVKDVVEGMEQTTDKHHIIIKGKIKNHVYGDEDRINQVITNLISNAIKYSPNGKKILITLKAEARRARVSVQDFGIGISPEHKAHIFERFYRAYGESEKSFPGLGMGLFISQDIIKKHRGKLDFTSKEGKGTTFFFTLPYAKESN